MSFSEILNDLIIDNGLTKRQVAIKYKITASQMTSFLRGAIPSIETAVRIANYFSCSLNYLMGIDEYQDQTKITNEEYDLENFFDRYNRVLELNKISHWRLCQNLEISESNIRGWKRGAVPKLDTLAKISSYLNCSIDYLLGRAKN